ncbi:hypothetical protein AMJ49_01410 [Parcubacteria bacterium DG_74_2]|nr:MAG: hypothetical protein AMJ49_01410 [Parcubacteria bacterium DG_74_2]
MLVIRLFRIGKKNQPSFKIVVADKRNPPKSGRFIEEVGFWNPLTKEKILNEKRIKYWLSVGAKPSASIQNLLISEKIIEGKKIPKHKKPREKKKVPLEKKVAKKEKETAEEKKRITEEKKEIKKEKKEVPEEKKKEA